MTPTGPTREPSVADLKAVADHAGQRVALYRRKVLLGRGEPRRLAELERVSAGAAGRVKTAIDRSNARPLRSPTSTEEDPHE